MDMTPQAIRAASFRTVKRGYDPDEVEAFRVQVAELVEFFQNQATSMEARARAAVAKLQELTQQAARAEREGAAEPAPATSDELPDMISRTLLLAQRTADAALADAREQATSLVENGRDEAARMLESARVMASRTIDDARHEARRAAEDERVRADNEVQALLARRDFLLADVDHLELFLASERERLREAAHHLLDMVERAPGGLGEARRPLLSASDDTESFWGDAAAADVDEPVGDDRDRHVGRAGEHDVDLADAAAVAAVIDAVIERMPSLASDDGAPSMGDVTAGLDVTAAMPADPVRPTSGAEVGVGRAAPRHFDLDLDADPDADADHEGTGVDSAGDEPSRTAATDGDDAGWDDGWSDADATVPLGPERDDTAVISAVGAATPATGHPGVLGLDAGGGSTADDTWDPLTLPLRPDPGDRDGDWDDDLPTSAAAMAAKAAADRRRAEADADAAARADDAPSDELWRSAATPSVRKSFDDLSERLRRPLLDDSDGFGAPYDADDDSGFIVGGDELQ